METYAGPLAFATVFTLVELSKCFVCEETTDEKRTEQRDWSIQACVFRPRVIKVNSKSLSP